ncbi:hypothetical protein ACFL4G_08080 [Thermodesulfobacteriota bacterium]
MRNEEGNPKLSAWVRENNELDKESPQLSSELIKSIQNSLPNYSPSQKQLVLLRNLERKTEFPGQFIRIEPKRDIPLAWADCDEEFAYYFETLTERKLVKPLEFRGDYIGKIFFDVQITSEGWDFLDRHERTSVFSDQVFIAMSFSPEMKAAWKEAIQPAIEDAGYKAYRVDREPHIERIDVKIISEIKNSILLVADVTEQKAGVYFEAGFAIGIGIPVIWSVRKDDHENVHFDTRQYNHIVWESHDELEDQLYDFICAQIGKKK